MAKLYDVTIKTGEYQSDGQTKGRYTKLGVVMSGSDGGQFMLLEPNVDLAGCLMLQNIMAAEKGQQARSSLMCAMFEGENNQGQQQQQNQQQQRPQQQQQPVGAQQGRPQRPGQFNAPNEFNDNVNF